jgi:hypothetical protein
MSSVYRRATVPEPERRGTVQRLNDRTLEYVILALRVVSLVSVFGGWTVALVAWIWSGDWRWGATLAVEVITGAVAAYLGFWVWGNEEWRHDADPR